MCELKVREKYDIKKLVRLSVCKAIILNVKSLEKKLLKISIEKLDF